MKNGCSAYEIKLHIIIIIIYQVLYFYYYYHTPCDFFRTTINWLFFTGVWVTANLPRSPRLWVADLNSGVVWMLSIHYLIFNSTSPLSNHLGTVPSAPITIGITVTLVFDSFLSSLAKYKHLPLFSFSLIFFLRSVRTAKSTIWKILSFFVIRFSLPLGIR